MPSHLIGNFARGGTRFLCGQKYTPRELAHDGLPTCAECQRIDDVDDASLLALQQMPPSPTPPLKNDPIVPAGYRPKGAR